MKAEKILQNILMNFVYGNFSESETLFKSAENKIENESEKNTFRHKIYNLKSDNNYAKFSEFIILGEINVSIIKIGSRKSQLAIKQTEAVIKNERAQTTLFEGISTKGDRQLDKSLKVSAEKVFYKRNRSTFKR